MSKYCLLVWDDEFDGELVYNKEVTALFVDSLEQTKDYKSYMESEHPNATYKIFHYHNVGGIGKEYKNPEQEEIVKRKGNKVTIKAGKGYCENVDKLAVIKDNGNGYTIKFPSHLSTQADIYMSLDYGQAEYLWLALSKFNE